MDQPNQPQTNSEQLLRYSLLDDPLISYRRAADGQRQQASLPQLFVAMAGNEVRDFPALRAHQRHPWHAFLCQLAAIALHHADQAEPFSTAEDWRSALLTLSPDDPDGAAWCLVSPPGRPALLQAAVQGTDVATWDQEIRSPDRLDMLITARNHDQKQTRMSTSGAEDWLFSLLSLQTQEGSNSGSYKGVSRMNSGAGSRPGVGVSVGRHVGLRWLRDTRVLLENRDAIAEKYDLQISGGIALAWLQPWDGVKAIRFRDLDPLYIEICRRVRLVLQGQTVVAATFKTPIARIAEAEDRKGRTGDAWTPINIAEGKTLSISNNGFGYVLMSELMLGGTYEPSIAQDMTTEISEDTMQMVAQGIARGNSKTGGYHERRIPIAPKLRRLMLSPQRATVADMAKQRIAAISEVRKLLWQSLTLLLNAGATTRDAAEGIKNKASGFARPFERDEDARFFVDLTAEVEAQDGQAERLKWMLGLVSRAEAVLKRTFDAGPRNGMQRYRAQAAALSRFHGGLRGDKSPLPVLAQYYRDSNTSRQEETIP